MHHGHAPVARSALGDLVLLIAIGEMPPHAIALDRSPDIDRGVVVVLHLVAVLADAAIDHVLQHRVHDVGDPFVQHPLGLQLEPGQRPDLDHPPPAHHTAPPRVGG